MLSCALLCSSTMMHICIVTAVCSSHKRATQHTVASTLRCLPQAFDAVGVVYSKPSERSSTLQMRSAATTALARAAAGAASGAAAQPGCSAAARAPTRAAARNPRVTAPRATPHTPRDAAPLATARVGCTVAASQPRASGIGRGSI